MRTTTLLFISLLSHTAFAQWDIPSVNTPVRAAAGVDAVTPLSAAGRQGSTYISWFEQSDGGYILRMQRLDVDGVAEWDSEGLLVSEEPQNSALFRYDLAGDLEGNAIVAFQDERSGSLDVVAYKVGPDGSMVWGSGLALPTPDGTGLAPSIGVLSDNRVVFAWNTDSSPSAVAYLVVSQDGVPDPAGTQQITSIGNLGRPKIVPCSDGGFWIQYVEQDGNFLTPGVITAARVSATLELGTPVIVSTKTIAGFYFPQPITDGHDGMYVAFNTSNGSNENITDLFVQRLRADGSLWSPKGTSVEDGVTTQRFTFSATPALVNDDDGLMLAYQRTDLAQSEGGISVQRMDTAGNRMLSDAGVVVIPANSLLPAPFGNAALTDGMVTTTLDVGTGPHKIAAQQIGLDGLVVGPPISLCSVSSEKDDPTLVPFRNGQAIIAWQDQRSGTGGIYAQPVQLDFNVGITAPSSTDNTFVLWPNPTTGQLRALLPGEAADLLDLRVIDATGRTIWTKRRVPFSAEGILLDLSTLAPGSYALVANTQKGSLGTSRFIRQ
ncbi:MAG TPA: hypothetical protein PK149_08980 [Flavobacteriales bacterium]|nr:hypothetical protein [Flavobacteriales bacterium]